MSYKQKWWKVDTIIQNMWIIEKKPGEFASLICDKIVHVFEKELQEYN